MQRLSKMKLFFIIFIFTVANAIEVPLTWQVGVKANNKQQEFFPAITSSTNKQSDLIRSRTTNNDWLPVLQPINTRQVITTPKYILKKKPHIHHKKVPPKFYQKNKKHLNSKNLPYLTLPKKTITKDPFGFYPAASSTQHKHFQTRNVKGAYPQVNTQPTTTHFLVPFDFNPTNPFTQYAHQQTPQQIQVLPQVSNFNTFSTIPSVVDYNFNPFAQNYQNQKTFVRQQVNPSQQNSNLGYIAPQPISNFDFDTKNPFNKNYRDDKTHEPLQYDRYYDRGSIPKVERKEDERAPISIHDQPQDVPTRPIYPGEGKWAKQRIKHKPFISKQQYTNLDEPQEKPDGHDIFEANQKVFENQKAQFGQKLRDFPEKHQLGTSVDNNLRRNNSPLNKEDVSAENEEEEEEEFVPERLYAQVRHSEAKKHLPPEAAEEERLKEVIKDSKVQTVYSEEGYEDSAYDHAGHEKIAETDEEYAKKQKKEEEKQEKNDPAKKHNLHLPQRETTSYSKEAIKIDDDIEEDKKEKLTLDDDDDDDDEIDDDSDTAGTKQEEESKLTSVEEGKLSENHESTNLKDNTSNKDNSAAPTKETKTLTTTDEGNGNTELEISSEVKVIRQPNNSTKSHKYVKIYPKSHNSVNTDKNIEHDSTPDKYAKNRIVNLVSPTTVASRDISDSFLVEIPATTQATTAIPKIKVAFLDLTNINLPKAPQTTKSSFLESSHRKTRRKRAADTASEIHVDTEFIDGINHQLGTPTLPPDTSAKYPYYKKYKEMGIPEDSALRYSEDLTKVPVKTGGKLAFYKQADAKMKCGEVNPEVQPVPDRAKNGEKPTDNEEVTKGPRLGQLGDKIDCFKAKYFGENPFDNPFFQEEEVGQVKPIFELERVTAHKREIPKKQQPQKLQPSSHKKAKRKVPQLDSDLAQSPTDYEENEIDYDSHDSDKNKFSLKNFFPDNFFEKAEKETDYKIASKYIKNDENKKQDDSSKSDTTDNESTLNNAEKITEILATAPSISLLTTPKYTIDLKPKHIYDQIELLGYLPEEEELGSKIVTEIPNNKVTDEPDSNLKKNEENSESPTEPPNVEKDFESPNFDKNEKSDLKSPPKEEEFKKLEVDNFKDFGSPKFDKIEEFDSPLKSPKGDEEFEKPEVDYKDFGSPKFNKNIEFDSPKSEEIFEEPKVDKYEGFKSPKFDKSEEFDSPIKSPKNEEGFEEPKIDKYKDFGSPKKDEEFDKPEVDYKDFESPKFDKIEEFNSPEKTPKNEEIYEDPKADKYKGFESPKFDKTEEFDSPIKPPKEEEIFESPKVDKRKDFDEPITPLVIDGFKIPKLDQYEKDFDVSKFYKNEDEELNSIDKSIKQASKTVDGNDDSEKDNQSNKKHESITYEIKKDNKDNKIKEKVIDEVHRIRTIINDEVEKDDIKVKPVHKEKQDKLKEHNNDNIKNTRQGKELEDVNIKTDVTTSENLPDAEELTRLRRKKPMFQIFDVNKFLPTTRPPIDYKSITYPTTTAKPFINPNIFRRKGPLYQIFDVNKYLPTTPYPLFKNIITLSTVLPKYKVLSEVFYKDDIKPNEQINVFTDIINNIKNATKKLFRDNFPIGSENIPVTISSPVPNKNKRNEEKTVFGNHADTYRNVYENLEETYFSTTNTPLESPNSEDAENITPFESNRIRKKKKRRRIKTTTTTEKVPEVVEETTPYQDESAEVIGLMPPKPNKYKTIIEDDIPYNIRQEIAEEKIVNKYLVHGMKPPPKQIVHVYSDYLQDNVIHRRRLKPKRAKRSANRPAYSGVSRNRGQQPVTEPSEAKKEEDDDYVPHRPKNYHYDEKTGKIVYDKVEKQPAEEEESEEVVYVEVEEEKPQTTAKPKQNPIFATATPPPAGESYTDFIQLLKTASGYREIPDPTTTEKGKEVTTSKVETTTLKPISTTPPEFLSILAKVRSDTNYKAIEDKKKTKATTTTEAPVEEEEDEDESQIEYVKNSPGGAAQVGANLGIFDITDFLPKVKTYVPKTAIDTSKYKSIQRQPSPSTTINPTIDTTENNKENEAKENDGTTSTTTGSTALANTRSTTTTEKSKTKATHRRRLTTLRSSRSTTTPSSLTGSESITQEKTRRPHRRRRVKTTPAPADKTVTDVVDSSTKIVRRRSERDNRNLEQLIQDQVDAPRILNRVDRVDPQYEKSEREQDNGKAKVRQIYNLNPTKQPTTGNYRDYYTQSNGNILPREHSSSDTVLSKSQTLSNDKIKDTELIKHFDNSKKHGGNYQPEDEDIDNDKSKQSISAAKEQKVQNAEQKDVQIFKDYDKSKKHGGNYRYENGKLIQEKQEPADKMANIEVIGSYDKNKKHGGNYKYEDQLVNNNEPTTAENNFESPKKNQELEDLNTDDDKLGNIDSNKENIGVNEAGKEQNSYGKLKKKPVTVTNKKTLLDSSGEQLDIFSEYDKNKKHGGNYRYENDDGEEKREKRIDDSKLLTEDNAHVSSNQPTLEDYKKNADVEVFSDYDANKRHGGNYRRKTEEPLNNDHKFEKDIPQEEIQIQSVYFNDYKKKKATDGYKRYNDKKKILGVVPDKDQQRELIENSKIHRRLIDDVTLQSEPFYGDPKLPGAINSLMEVVDLTSEELEEIVTTAEIQLSEEDQHNPESNSQYSTESNDFRYNTESSDSPHSTEDSAVHVTSEKYEDEVTSEKPRKEEIIGDDLKIVFSEAGKIVPTLKPVSYIKDPSKRLYYYAPIK